MRKAGGGVTLAVVLCAARSRHRHEYETHHMTTLLCAHSLEHDGRGVDEEAGHDGVPGTGPPVHALLAAQVLDPAAPHETEEQCQHN